MKHGKKYIDAAKLIENNKTYDPTEALELCCKTATAKFDETVELHVRLGVDGRHADQQVRGAVVLPNGTGKTVRVCAIAKGPAAAAAEAAGIDTASGVPNKNKVGSITLAQAEEIAKTKMPDLNAASLEAAFSMIAGTCRSMGVTVEG